MKELEQLVSMKRRVAHKMLEEFASMVKPIVISGQSERETPLQSARGGSHAYDQQTAHAESVAAWQKNKDQKDFIPNRTTGYQEMGFGISPDPSSMMEEFQFGKKGAVVTTGLQNNKDDSIPAATRIQQIKDPAEDNFEFSDERSEEHTSELQSQSNLVCLLLLDK